MSVTSKLFYDKLRKLRPDLTLGITLEMLNKIYDSRTRLFFQWFYDNVSRANILSNEEIKIKNTLQDAGKWLEDEALDVALAEATKDCQDLLQLISLDDIYREDLFEEYLLLKESCKEDEEYLQSLRCSIKNFKEIENKLEDNIEETESILSKEQIETEMLYEDCNIALKEFHRNNCQFSKDIDVLLNTYADTVKNQSSAVLWSQLPIDLFIKQIKLYNHYLSIHIKKYFGNSKEEQNASDYASLINDSRERQINEKMQELSLCKNNLTNSKIKEIGAIIQEESYIEMLQCVQDIYNNGILKIPNNSKMQDEILTLTAKRDILEQNVKLLRDQQFSEVVQFAEMETIKILKNDAIVRLERRNARLEKLKNLYILAGEHGHVYVDLLCMLMEMQYHNLCEVVEFIADARHYIATEYKLSSERCENIQQQQNEYRALVTQSSRAYNAFNDIFISMIFGDISTELLSSALKRYDDLITDNSNEKLTLKTYLNDKIDKLEELEMKINKNYMAEAQKGPTISLKPILHEISTGYKETFENIKKVKADITRIRNNHIKRLKIDSNLIREKNILWQRFLTDSDTLKMKYEEAKQRANESHFGDTTESKSN